MDEYAANRDRFSGFAEAYDRYRFRPPEVLAGILCRYAKTDRPALVVDLGCATGLSTRFWADRAERVVGVEPAPDMLAFAVAENRLPNVEYREGYGHDTGLPDGAADIVTCSQSFHWMDPGPTLAEVARILRPGGVFAAYHYTSRPSTGIAGLDAAVDMAVETLCRLEEEHGIKKDTRFFAKDEYLPRMEESGVFSLVREIHLHSVETTTAERVVEGFKTWGAVQVLLRKGLTDGELLLPALAAAATQHLGDASVPVYVSYVAALGVT